MLGHLQEHVFTRLLTYRQAEIIWFILQLILLLLPGHFCLLGDGGEGPWHQPLPCQMLFLVDLLLLWLMQGLWALSRSFSSLSARVTWYPSEELCMKLCSTFLSLTTPWFLKELQLRRSVEQRLCCACVLLCTRPPALLVRAWAPPGFVTPCTSAAAHLCSIGGL